MTILSISELRDLEASQVFTRAQTQNLVLRQLLVALLRYDFLTEISDDEILT